MLAIGRQTDYACRILLHLAMQPPGSRITAAGIAEQRLIPPALIRRIVTGLGAAGLIRTARGRAGGLTLGRPASEISLLDVVQTMEGPLALNPCTIAPQEDPDACPFIPVCPVHQAWMQVQASFLRELSQVTFDKLATNARFLSALPIREDAGPTAQE